MGGARDGRTARCNVWLVRGRASEIEDGVLTPRGPRQAAIARSISMHSRGPVRAAVSITTKKETSMSDKQILNNQSKILANQTTIQKNQGKIIANQGTIVTNQAKLDRIIANQNTIKANQKKILANQKKILAK
jgi:hypothetical protein